jgi:hypothetical protein
MRLRDKMEHLDPTETGDLGWLELTDRDREFYRLCVLDLIASAEAVDAILRQPSDYSRIDRRIEEGE